MREHRISSRGDKEQYLKLRQKLLAEGRSFASWLEEQIENELNIESKKSSIPSLHQDVDRIDKLQEAYSHSKEVREVVHPELPKDGVRSVPKPKFDLKNKIK